MVTETIPLRNYHRAELIDAFRVQQCGFVSYLKDIELAEALPTMTGGSGVAGGAESVFTTLNPATYRLLFSQHAIKNILTNKDDLKITHPLNI